MVISNFSFCTMNIDSWDSSLSIDKSALNLSINATALNLIKKIDQELQSIVDIMLVDDENSSLKHSIVQSLTESSKMYQELLAIGYYIKSKDFSGSFRNALFYAAWIEKNFFNFIKEIIILNKYFKEAQCNNLKIDFLSCNQFMQQLLLNTCLRITPFLEDKFIFISDNNIEIKENFISLNDNIFIVNKFKKFMLDWNSMIKDVYKYSLTPSHINMLNEFFYLFVYSYYVSNNYLKLIFINSSLMHPNVWRTFLETIALNKKTSMFNILEMREDVSKIAPIDTLEEIAYLRSTPMINIDCYAMITRPELDDNNIFLLLKNQNGVEKRILVENYCILKKDNI